MEAYPIGRVSAQLRQPDNVLAELFPSMRFYVQTSLTKKGEWYIFVQKGSKYVGTFWDKKKGFPSDELIAKLMLVA